MKGSLSRGFVLAACVAAAPACVVPWDGARVEGTTGQKREKGRGGVSVEESRRAGYGTPEVVARLDDGSLDEASGLAASRVAPGLFWTHNDSGALPFIYAFDARGRRLGVWRVSGAKIYDWEDIALGPGPEASRPYLYVGDIGDNRRARTEVVVYRFPEPVVGGEQATSTRRRPLPTAPAEALRLKYPDGVYDAEALLVHPRTGDIYVLTKVPGASSGVYKLEAPYDAGRVNTLTKVGEFLPPTLVGGLVTGGDISPDGTRVVLCDYANGYELRLAGPSSPFDTIWKQPAAKFSLGEREQGEAVAYGDGGAAVYATSEGRRPPLIRVTVPR